ncbi:PREDICTED: la-related protein 1C-like isoform X2 [Ipomoea nil]|uniref:la-related protein 1C-like isoform X2 n=1 Tax=Ipomoea nil TaxID=35883 RepID=UPI0009011719|nr:PREDICTED: la-related protein 1C-like isoform X2 [Ipomoea nil]
MAADCNSPNEHKSPHPSSAIPWAQVVRGGDSEAKASSTPRSPANPSENNNASLNKENKSENEAATHSVIGGEVSWPALSECTRSNSPKIAASLPQGPVIQQSSDKQSSQKQHNNNSHSNSNSKHTMAGRQRSMKHRSGVPGQGGFSGQPPPPHSPPPFPIFEMPYGNFIPAVMDPSMVGPRPVVGGVVHLQANHSSPNNFPRRSSGAHPHGDWTYNQGNRHNHGRRDGHPPYQFAPRHGGFIPPPSSPPFLPPPIQSLGCPIGFDVATPFMSSYVPTLPRPPPPSMIYPIDTNLSTSLLKQIDYYFSDANLDNDHYLRSKMDSEGWVPINLIANFHRVTKLTNNILFILDCLKASKVVEVQGERIRRRNNWKKWIYTSQSTTKSEI